MRLRTHICQWVLKRILDTRAQLVLAGTEHSVNRSGLVQSQCHSESFRISLDLKVDFESDLKVQREKNAKEKRENKQTESTLASSGSGMYCEQAIKYAHTL